MQVEPIIRVSELDINFGKQKVLENISFEVFPGEYIGIVGPNGGGKTTLLKAILGLIPMKKGKIKSFGRIGYVPQFTTERFFLPISVEEIVETGAKKNNPEAVDTALEMVAAQSLKYKLFEDLSGGQKQRVIIARAMAGNPDILILDEPLSAVDVPSQKHFYELIGQLNTVHKLTILMVTHDLEMVASETSRILCLNRKLHNACHPHDLLSAWTTVFGEGVKPIHHHPHNV